MTDHKHCEDPNCPPTCAEDCCVPEESANQPVVRRCDRCGGRFTVVENFDGETELHHNCEGPLWKDGLAEREAGLIFAAKADEYKASLDHHMKLLSDVQRERNELMRERDIAHRVRDEYRTSHDRMAGLLAEAQRERDRLTARNAELVAALRKNVCHWAECDRPECEELRDLVARIDAEAAGK